MGFYEDYYRDTVNFGKQIGDFFASSVTQCNELKEVHKSVCDIWVYN